MGPQRISQVGADPAIPADPVASRNPLVRSVVNSVPAESLGPSQRVQGFLRALDALALAALLHEIGRRLYELDIRNWRALADMRDELVDRVTFTEKDRRFEAWLRKPPAKVHEARRMKQRDRKRG